MSLFGWLFPTAKINQRAPGPLTVTPVRGRSARASQSGPPTHQAARLQRREQLYGVVREAMARAGVLSADYAFKVLMLDTQGERFIVMLDVAKEYSANVGLWSDTEAWITRSAQIRLGIEVKSVYWRVNPRLRYSAGAQGAPVSTPAPLASGPAALTSSPAPLTATPASAPAPLAPPAPRKKVVPLDGRTDAAAFDPIDATEMAAFRQALAKARARASEARATRLPPSATSAETPDSGFADTVMPDEQERQRPDALSSTMYGEPR